MIGDKLKLDEIVDNSMQIYATIISCIEKQRQKEEKNNEK